MKRTWARFEAVMKQGSEGEMAALPPGNPEGEKRGPGAVKRSTKPCSGESQSERHDEARDSPRMWGKLALPIGMSLQPWITPAHAGKTHIHQDKIRGLWDHPRTCGENVSIHSQNLLHSGSPPRVRGNSTTFLCTKSITSSVRNFRLNQHFCFLHIQTKQKVFRVNQRAINAWR